MADRTRRLYAEVKGRERFRLAVEMSVRGQHSESDQIVLTAPRVDVSRLDPAMCEAFEELRSLSREFDASTRKLFGCLLTLDVMRDLFEKVAAESACGDLEVYSVPLLLELLDQLSTVIEMRLRALEVAVGELGRERLGLEPETFHAAQPTWVQAGFVGHRQRIDDATLEPVEVASARADLLAGWGPEGLGEVPRPGEGR